MSVLQFDWEAVAHGSISAVLGRNERALADGSLAWDALAFVIGDRAVVLKVNADTDEILVAHEATPKPDDWQAVAPLADVIGKPLGWSWVGFNHRGYPDSFGLALGDVVPDALQPRLMFLSEGAALSCFDLTPRRG